MDFNNLNYHSLHTLENLVLCLLSLVHFSILSRWICIYPSYINVKKTLQEGRRIPKSKAVDNPTDMEIGDVLAAAGFKVG